MSDEFVESVVQDERSDDNFFLKYDSDLDGYRYFCNCCTRYGSKKKKPELYDLPSFYGNGDWVYRGRFFKQHDFRARESMKRHIASKEHKDSLEAERNRNANNNVNNDLSNDVSEEVKSPPAKKLVYVTSRKIENPKDRFRCLLCPFNVRPQLSKYWKRHCSITHVEFIAYRMELECITKETALQATFDDHVSFRTRNLTIISEFNERNSKGISVSQLPPPPTDAVTPSQLQVPPPPPTDTINLHWDMSQASSPFKNEDHSRTVGDSPVDDKCCTNRKESIPDLEESMEGLVTGAETVVTPRPATATHLVVPAQNSEKKRKYVHSLKYVRSRVPQVQNESSCGAADPAQTSTDQALTEPEDYAFAGAARTKTSKVAADDSLDMDLVNYEQESRRVELEERMISLEERKLVREHSRTMRAIELEEKEREVEYNAAMRQLCTSIKERQLEIEDVELQIRLEKLKELQNK